MNRKTMALTRGIGMIGAAVALMTGITYAALTSSVTLADNQVGVGTADLQIAAVGGTYGASIPGFKSLNLTPGSGTSAPFDFYLKNNGTIPLTLSISSTLTSGGLGSLDGSKIHATFYKIDGIPNPISSFTLADIMNGNANIAAPNNSLAAGATQQYRITWSADADAGSGSGGQKTDNFNVTIGGSAAAH